MDAPAGEGPRGLAGAGAHLDGRRDATPGVVEGAVDDLVGVAEPEALVALGGRPEQQPPRHGRRHGAPGTHPGRRRHPEVGQVAETVGGSGPAHTSGIDLAYDPLPAARAARRAAARRLRRPAVGPARAPGAGRPPRREDAAPPTPRWSARASSGCTTRCVTWPSTASPGRASSSSRSRTCGTPPTRCDARPRRSRRRCGGRRCAAAGGSCTCGGWSSSPDWSTAATSSSRCPATAPTTGCCDPTWWSTSPAASTSSSTPRCRSTRSSTLARARPDSDARSATPHLRPARPAAAPARRRAGRQGLLARAAGDPGVRGAVRARASRSCPRRSRPTRRCWSTPPTEQVVLATPTTLIALLRTVAYAWTQQTLADKAREIHELGRDLLRTARHDERPPRPARPLADRSGRAPTTGPSGSLENRVLVSARRFGELGVAADELDAPDAVVETPRPLTAAELLDDGRRAAPRAAGPRRRPTPGTASRTARRALTPAPRALPCTGEHRRASPQDALGRGSTARAPGRHRRRAPGAARRRSLDLLAFTRRHARSSTSRSCWSASRPRSPYAPGLLRHRRLPAAADGRHVRGRWRCSPAARVADPRDGFLQAVVSGLAHHAGCAGRRLRADARDARAAAGRAAQSGVRGSARPGAGPATTEDRRQARPTSGAAAARMSRRSSGGSAKISDSSAVCTACASG